MKRGPQDQGNTDHKRQCEESSSSAQQFSRAQPETIDLTGDKSLDEKIDELTRFFKIKEKGKCTITGAPYAELYTIAKKFSPEDVLGRFITRMQKKIECYYHENEDGDARKDRAVLLFFSAFEYAFDFFIGNIDGLYQDQVKKEPVKRILWDIILERKMISDFGKDEGGSYYGTSASKRRTAEKFFEGEIVKILCRRDGRRGTRLRQFPRFSWDAFQKKIDDCLKRSKDLKLKKEYQRVVITNFSTYFLPVIPLMFEYLRKGSKDNQECAASCEDIVKCINDIFSNRRSHKYETCLIQELWKVAKGEGKYKDDISYALTQIRDILSGASLYSGNNKLWSVNEPGNTALLIVSIYNVQEYKSYIEEAVISKVKKVIVIGDFKKTLSALPPAICQEVFSKPASWKGILDDIKGMFLIENFDYFVRQYIKCVGKDKLDGLIQDISTTLGGNNYPLRSEIEGWLKGVHAALGQGPSEPALLSCFTAGAAGASARASSSSSSVAQNGLDELDESLKSSSQTLKDQKSTTNELYEKFQKLENNVIAAPLRDCFENIERLTKLADDLEQGFRSRMERIKKGKATRDTWYEASLREGSLRTVVLPLRENTLGILQEIYTILCRQSQPCCSAAAPSASASSPSSPAVVREQYGNSFQERLIGCVKKWVNEYNSRENDRLRLSLARDSEILRKLKEINSNPLQLNDEKLKSLEELLHIQEQQPMRQQQQRPQQQRPQQMQQMQQMQQQMTKLHELIKSLQKKVTDQQQLTDQQDKLIKSLQQQMTQQMQQMQQMQQQLAQLQRRQQPEMPQQMQQMSVQATGRLFVAPSIPPSVPGEQPSSPGDAQNSEESELLMFFSSGSEGKTAVRGGSY